MQMTQQARGPAAERVRSEAHPCADRRGSILVEFALVSVAFYLILAGTLEVGRMITTAQIVQNAARTLARELALLPLPATMTFEQALDCDIVKARVFDRTKLAIRYPDDFNAATDEWPIVNRILLPLMIRTEVGPSSYLQFPGALVQRFGDTSPTVRIPRVTGRGANGVETIEWADVIEEVGASGLDPNSGPFGLASSGPELGLVAVRINCPYQAATMSAFQPVDITDPNPINEPILANDAGVSANSAGGTLINTSSAGGIYSGPYGLGKFYALNKEVRPFRRLVSAQAVFRREVFTAGTGCN